MSDAPPREMWPLTMPPGCRICDWAAAQIGAGSSPLRPCLWLDEAGQWQRATLGEAVSVAPNVRAGADKGQVILASGLLRLALASGRWEDVASAYIALGGLPPERLPEAQAPQQWRLPDELQAHG